MINIFRQLRWKLTLSYTLVTVSALLVILFVMTGLVLARVFVPENSLSPEGMIVGFMNSTYPSAYLILSQMLSQSSVDQKLIDLYLNNTESIINDQELFRIGAIRFWASTNASIRVLVIGADGTILGTNLSDDPAYAVMLGKQLNPTLVLGLEAPYRAALAGDTEPSHLYTTLEPNKRYVFAAPLFNLTTVDEKQVVGVFVVLFDAVPTQNDIPSHILKTALRSLLIFLLGVGGIGAVFGLFFAHGLSARFLRISETTDQWSLGDFSKYIEDPTGDEIAQFTLRLDEMAKQLQSLLRRRQEMAISEERNRLARDLHDSAKQQALAASLELGTALTLYERDPEGAKKHLAAADTLVDAVREELTNLVHELRPQDMDGQDFSEILREYASEWAQRSGIELNFDIQGNNEIPLETRETLFRITQEALANVARHSAASTVEISLKYEPNMVTLTVKDNGVGFDPLVQQVGIGLSSMRERAKSGDGNFIIESAPGSGTQVLVTLPCKGQSNEKAELEVSNG